MKKLSPRARRILWRAALALVVLVAAWCGWRFVLRPWLFPPSPLVMTPQLGLQNLQAKSLYYAGEARPWLLKLRPDLLAEDDRGAESDRAAGFAQATQNPRLFRMLDRKYHFDTLVLLGDRSLFQRLLEHLLEPEPNRRDFRLVYLDHWMFVFKRGANRLWQTADAEALKARMGNLRSEDQAAFLAKVADHLLAMGFREEAKRWLDQAVRADGSSPDALAGLAAYYAALTRWAEAESYADKALEERENFPPALQWKYLALLGSRHMIDAFKVSKRILEKVPGAADSPVFLWQHATSARLAAQYDAEVPVLTKLIGMAEKSDRPTGEYEFELADAYRYKATLDKLLGMDYAAKSLEHFRKALLDETLPPPQRKFAEEQVRTISERTGLR